MSKEAEREEVDPCCASCGKAEVDNVKLKDCDGGCDLVKYCSEECNENHREQHEEECKERKTELRDRDLFAMPDESHLGDCPICCLPMQLDPLKSIFMDCCSKLLCNGCHYTNQVREMDMGLEMRCPYRREPAPNSQEEVKKRCEKRTKKNDPAAMCFVGKKRYKEGDHESALEHFIKAAKLGNADAHYELSISYRDGEGVEKTRKGKFTI